MEYFPAIQIQSDNFNVTSGGNVIANQANIGSAIFVTQSVERLEVSTGSLVVDDFVVSGSSITTASFGHLMVGGGNFTSASLAAGGSGGETNQNAFSTIAVAGQDNVVADSATDTLTLAAGSNVTLTTTAGSDTVTIAAAGGGGGSSPSAAQVSGSWRGELSSSAVTVVGGGVSGSLVSTGSFGTGFFSQNVSIAGVNSDRNPSNIGYSNQAPLTLYNDIADGGNTPPMLKLVDTDNDTTADTKMVILFSKARLSNSSPS